MLGSQRDNLIDWLARQPERHLTEEFKPKPYEQLAGVLAAMGYEEEARAIRIERRRQQTRFMTWYEPWPASLAGKGMRFLSIIWQRLIGLLISYGYRPGKSAHQALAQTRQRCWQRAWVVDLDRARVLDGPSTRAAERMELRLVRSIVKIGTPTGEHLGDRELMAALATRSADL